MWVVQKALRLYPKGFRDAYGADLEQAIRDRLEAADGRGIQTAALLAKETLAILGSLPGAYATARAARARAPTRPTAVGRRRASSGLDPVRMDLVFALRGLRKSPLFTSAALLTLALGVGTTSTMFSVVNGVLLKPLPYSDPDRLVAIATRWDDAPDRDNPMSKPDILDLDALPALEAVAGYTTGSDVLVLDGVANLVTSTRVTTGLLATFDLRPVLGRDIEPPESSPGHPRVAVVSHTFWQAELQADPHVVGRNLDLDGDAYQIVGVAPEGFEYPGRTQIWRPYVSDMARCGRGCHNYAVVGRTAPSVPVASAREQAKALATRLAREFPQSNTGKNFGVTSLENHLLGDVREELWILLGAVGLVLLVACANVANLLMARGQGRVAEMGVRASLGATKRRLTRQLLTESFVLAALGGGLGLAICSGGVGILRRFSPPGIPRMDQVGVDAHVVWFTMGLVAFVTLLFGLSPALHLARSSPATALQSSGRGAGRSRPTYRFRRVLLASEMALSVFLLIGAGLLVRSLAGIHRIEPGFRVDDVSRFSLVLPDARYPELSEITRFYEELESRIGALPQVASVGSAYGAPMSNWGSTGDVLVEGRPVPAPGEETFAALRTVTPGYLDAQGIPVLRGRPILATDDADAPPVALVNETFARQNFPGSDPLQERVQVTVDLGFGSPTWSIVGIVPDIRTASLTRGTAPEVYVPQAQMGPRQMTVVMRSKPGADSPLPAVRQILADMDPALPLRNAETMRQVLGVQTASARFYLTLLAGFAGLALLLASIGLYGVMAYMVSTQRREIGIRLALGARREGVIRMVLAKAAPPTLFGLGVGLAGAMAGGRLMEGFLYQVNPRDPVVFAAVALLLLAVASFSSLIPARRASRVQPGEALQMD